MDAELKAKWVKALRSRKYKQGCESLRDQEGRMCCLGVLCHIQGAPEDTLTDVGEWDIPRKYNAGLKKKQRMKLACMNDGSDAAVIFGVPRQKKHTFKQIADYIDANL